MIAGLLALTSASIFLGAAAYVLFVEHVARATLDDGAALQEWQPSYKRGALMQASIALVTTTLAAAAWWQTANLWFAGAAILALLPWPWTLLVIKPTNDRLLDMKPDQAGSESRNLLARWGRLHAMRFLLSLAATVALLAGLAR